MVKILCEYNNDIVPEYWLSKYVWIFGKYLKSLDVDCNNFGAVVKLKWKIFCRIWFFIFITHKYHILKMHTTHSLLRL